MSGADGQAHGDARTLHAALAVAGSCPRVELALALGWDLQRLRRACARLAADLDGGALCLIEAGAELALTLAPGALDDERAARLSALADTRRELSAAEAARVLELIGRLLTEPHPLVGELLRGPVDHALVERGVLTAHPAADGSGEMVLAAHPDLLFGLGLCAAPTCDALPPRPAVPGAQDAAHAPALEQHTPSRS